MSRNQFCGEHHNICDKIDKIDKRSLVTVILLAVLVIENADRFKWIFNFMKAFSGVAIASTGGK